MNGNGEALFRIAQGLQTATGWRPEAEPSAFLGALRAERPDAEPAIRALAGALALGAASRTKGGDVSVAVERLAEDIVLLEAIPISQARVGAALAARLSGPADVPVPDFAADPVANAEDSWLGASQIATPGAAPLRQAETAAAPLGKPLAEYLKDRRVLAGIAAAIAILVWQNAKDIPPPVAPMPPPDQRQAPAPMDGPPTPPPMADANGPPPPPPSNDGTPPTPPPGQQGTGAAVPVLVDPQSGQPIPQLGFEDMGNAYAYRFSLPGSKSPFPSAVVVTKSQAWGSGQILVFAPSTTDPIAVSQATPFTLARTDTGVQRTLSTSQWVQNQVGLGDVCIVAASQGGQDVPTRGFNLCILTSQCGDMIGCGQVR